MSSARIINFIYEYFFTIRHVKTSIRRNYMAVTWWQHIPFIAFNENYLFTMMTINYFFFCNHEILDFDSYKKRPTDNQLGRHVDDQVEIRSNQFDIACWRQCLSCPSWSSVGRLRIKHIMQPIPVMYEFNILFRRFFLGK